MRFDSTRGSSTSRLRRAYAASAALAIGLIGCELIVSSSVPDFRCTPDVPGACPPNQVCDRASLSCVPANEAGLTDVVTSDRDVQGDDDDAGDASKPAALGAHCDTTKTFCAAGLLCGSPGMLTAAIIPTAADSVCTSTCCTSADCPSGFVCFGPGTGGNYCISSQLAKRGTLGAKKPGEACTTNGECRSGVCANDKCLDLCCSVDDCFNNTTCRVKSISTPPPARENWVCADPEPGASLVDSSGCSGGGGTCKNDNCQGLPAVCRPTCCRHDECSYPNKSLSFCAYGRFPTTQSSTKWCFTDAGPNGSPVGADCNGDTDCLQRFCDPDLKKCGTICCRDEDCAKDEQCSPTVSGQLLRCVKKK